VVRVDRCDEAAGDGRDATVTVGVGVALGGATATIAGFALGVGANGIAGVAAVAGVTAGVDVAVGATVCLTVAVGEGETTTVGAGVCEGVGESVGEAVGGRLGATVVAGGCEIVALGVATLASASVAAIGGSTVSRTSCGSSVKAAVRSFNNRLNTCCNACACNQPSPASLSP